MKRIIKWLTGESDTRLFKSYILSCGASNGGALFKKRSNFLNRLSFLALCIAFPLACRPCKKSDRLFTNIIIGANEDDEKIKLYKKLVNGSTSIREIRAYYWREGFYLNSYKDLNNYLKTWFKIINLGCRCLILRIDDIYKKPLYKFIIYNEIIKILRPDNVILIDYSQSENYLLALTLPEVTKTIFVPTNSRLYEFMRYGYFKNITLILSSPPQADEFASYEKFGWIETSNVTIVKWKFLFAPYIYKYNREPKVKIGYYSSGEWARKNGVLRSSTKEEIIENMKITNYYWSLAQEVIYFLCSYSKKNNFSFKVYMHPYEKEIINKYAIYPPYYNESALIDENVLTNKSNCTSNLFEAELGIVTTSSILYDRLHYNLPTFFYSPDENTKEIRSKNIYQKKYLPSYEKFSFLDISSLEIILNNHQQLVIK